MTAKKTDSSKSKTNKNNGETTLYRKYRPLIFEDVIGQDHIIKVLKGSIDEKNISHAYLFSGSRGTGKTSIARIFAQNIGCKGNDLYEIDAASNRGIDDVRGIRESVTTLPFESEYKVYIIDEAHMLTKEAWNAFLKTLEEPPKYVVFILATTEPEKIPDTVVSRCQTFQFRKPNQTILREFVMEISKKEGFKLENAGADLVALLSDGSYRDALGILQKITSFSKDKEISLSEIELVTGAPKGKLVNNIILAIAEKNIHKAIETVQKVVEINTDIKLFVKLILTKLRFVLFLKLKAGMDEIIKSEVSEEDFEFLKNIANTPDLNINSQTILVFLETYELTGKAYSPELPLELTLVKLIGEK